MEQPAESLARNNVEQPVTTYTKSGAEQSAAATTAFESTAKRPVDTATAAQPGRGSKAPRKSSTSASASATLIDALQTRVEDLGEAHHPLRVHDDTNAAQLGPKYKQRRLTAMFPAADSQEAGAAAPSASAAAAAAAATIVTAAEN